MPQTLSNASNGVNRSQPGPANNGEGSRVRSRPVPFARASKAHTERGENRTGNVSASNQTLALRVPVYGYLDVLYLEVTVTTAGNAAAVAFNIDAPWNFFRNIQFRDVNGTPIKNISGYQAYLLAKFGGYRLFRPEGSALTFTTVTGGGATGGSFTFVLPLYVGFGRDCLGVLPNMDASAQYQMEVTLGTTADLYSVAPTNPGAFSITLSGLFRSRPDVSDQFGNVNQTTPPNLGTVQYDSVQNFSWTGTGEQSLMLPRVGNLIRNHILVFRDGTGARSNTVVPVSIFWEWDSSNMYSESVLSRRAEAYRLYGFDVETGMLLYPRVGDPDKVPVGEYGDDYLPTAGTTKLLIRFTPGATGALEVITNDIVPVGSIFAASPVAIES